MSIKEIKAFSEKAKTDAALGEQLKTCEKVRDMIALGKTHGFTIDEVELYPPNEPQFIEEQLSLRLAKALLRV